MDAPVLLIDQLLASGLLISTGVDGVYLRAARFDRVVDALDAMVGRAGEIDAPEVFRFPPAMSSQALVTSGYLRNFPQLLGTIHCFCGDDKAHRRLLRCIDVN